MKDPQKPDDAPETAAGRRRPEKRAAAESYDAGKIRVLGDIQAVRQRPAMYIGDTGARGLHHLVEEVVANSIDEALAGRCKNIEIALRADGSCSVTDDGSGIPVDIHEATGKPALEVVMTMLHAGGKFDHDTYKVSGGLHGVGVTCVNALSEWLTAEVRRDGGVYFQEYARGVPVTGVERRGITKTRGTRDHLQAGPGDLRRREARVRHHPRPRARAGVPEQRRAADGGGRADGPARGLPLRGRAARVRRAPQPRQAGHPSRDHLPLARGRARTPSRSPSSTTTATRRRCSRSRTPSTRTRAART